MGYIVWQKKDYGEEWTRYDCETDRQLQETILERIRAPEEIVVTVPMQYKIDVKVTEPPAAPKDKKEKKHNPIHEAAVKEAESAAQESEAGPDKDPGD